MGNSGYSQINSLLPAEEQQANVPPSEEPVFILTSSQLQDVVTQAVEKAIQPLKDEVAELAARVEAHSRKIYHEEAQPLQRDRGDILRALLAANDGKMLRQEARRKMHMEENRFSELLKTQKEYIETRPSKLKPREKLLLLK